jgi:hypothetical protein
MAGASPSGTSPLPGRRCPPSALQAKRRSDEERPFSFAVEYLAGGAGSRDGAVYSAAPPRELKGAEMENFAERPGLSFS